MDLRRFLFEKNLPVKKFAEDLGISVSLVYHLLNRQRMPSRALALKIEKYTDGAVTRDELLFPNAEKSSRWVLNEDELQSRLDDYGMRICKLEKIVKPEQHD